MHNSLISISEKMKCESPVFIVGAPRSGTSILYRTIQYHSRFKPLNCTDSAGVELTESNVFRNPHNVYQGANSDAFSFMLKNNTSFEEFLRLVQPIQKQQRLFVGGKLLYKALIKINTIAAWRTFFWHMNRYDVLIRTYIYFAQSARGVSRILEKTPLHISCIPEILTTFPNAKLLFMQRHPIDVFSSYRRRLVDAKAAGASWKHISWLNISPKSFCSKYSAYSELALQAARSFPDAFMIVKYEDFTSYPKETLADLFSFLGEPFEETCIPKDDTQKSLWKDDPNLFSSIQVSTKKWEKYISPEEVRWVEAQLAAVMEKFDYQPYFA